MSQTNSETGAYDISDRCGVFHSLSDAGIRCGYEYTMSLGRRGRTRIFPVSREAQLRIADVLWANNWMHTEAAYISPERLACGA